MPLMHMKSPKAFSHNVKVEMEHGKPQKQAVAIAYSEKRKAEHHKKMSHGGMVEDCPLCSKKPPHENQHEAGEESDNPLAGYAHGGMTETGYEKGINRGRKLESGVSYAGAHQRGQVYNEPQSKEESEGYAKEQHKKTLSEMRSMKKPNLYAEGGKVSCSNCHGVGCYECKDGYSHGGQTAANEKEPHLLLSDGGEVNSGPTLGSIINYPYAKKSAPEPKPSPSPTVEAGYDEGGGVEGMDHELNEVLGQELMEAFEAKDKKRIMECLEACVLSCMNKE